MSDKENNTSEDLQFRFVKKPLTQSVMQSEAINNSQFAKDMVNHRAALMADAFESAILNALESNPNNGELSEISEELFNSLKLR